MEQRILHRALKYPPPPTSLSCPTPGNTVPHHPLGDGCQVTPTPPHCHRTRTFSGTEIALKNERTQWQDCLAFALISDMHHRALNIQRPALKQVPLWSG